ncbi:MAG TPA: multicopper oxidase domain-containing protein [Caldilineaceae bacterium]|nr:multicopper oxidase domain-containing protein [Caldilineaceae bacterium]
MLTQHDGAVAKGAGHNDSYPSPSLRAPLSRRRFLQVSGACAGLLGLAGAGGLLAGCAAPPPVAALQPASTGDEVTSPVPDPEIDVEIVLRAIQDTQVILPGAATAVWRYVGEVRKGDPGALQPVPNSYLGPTIRVRQGQKVRIEFVNELDEASNIHWHGLIVPPEMDGHPLDLAPAGGSYRYEFEVRNRPGLYWYHPHAHGRTAAQVNQGLAGLFVVEEPLDKAAEGSIEAALPRDAQEVALVLQDRTFDADNQFVYLAAGSMDQMMGFLGERVLVNGQPDFVLPAATRAYRLRLLNGSNSRIYKLAWSDGAPLTVLGVDGGLLEAPVSKEAVPLAPGQRVELWADFRDRPVGSEVKLVSLPFMGVEAGMMHIEPPVPNGAALALMTVRIERAEAETLSLPSRLRPLERLAEPAQIDAAPLRRFALGMDDRQNWTINGRIFEMDEVADDERVRLGALEVWEFVNEMDPAELGMAAPGAALGGMPAGMGHAGPMQHGMHEGAMQGAPGEQHGGHGAASMNMKDFMAHPIHIHGVHFQVLERQVQEAYRIGWESVQVGAVDEGWLDTVLVMPGERVKLLLRFDGYPGRYVYHCHNLEHEDQTMMRNYLIET